MCRCWTVDGWRDLVVIEAPPINAKTIRHINRLEVLGTSTRVEEGRIAEYHTQVRLYFEVETSR